MTPFPFPWAEWLTASSFRIRVAPAAVEKLEQLPAETQDRLRQMMQDIAELADLMGPSSDSWHAGQTNPLLLLTMGRVNVRYSISEENRTLTIEHVIVPEELEDVG